MDIINFTSSNRTTSFTTTLSGIPEQAEARQDTVISTSIITTVLLYLKTTEIYVLKINT